VTEALSVGRLAEMLANSTVEGIVEEVKALINFSIAVIITIVAALRPLRDAGIFTAVLRAPILIQPAIKTGQDLAAPPPTDRSGLLQLTTGSTRPTVEEITRQLKALIDDPITIVV